MPVIASPIVAASLRMVMLLLGIAMVPACSDSGGAAAPADAAGLAPSPSNTTTGTVVVTPQAVTVSTRQSQQFTAMSDNGTTRTLGWRVDGIVGGNSSVGVISPTGLFTPAAQPASHQISVFDAQDPTQQGSARVDVLALSGVLTYHNDNARTGQNTNETHLTPANVNTQNFGKLFSLAVDGLVYAQPLYVAKVTVSGELHNLVLVATEHSSVYAFDADRPGAPLWHTRFIDEARGITTQPSQDTGCPDIVPEIGITGTPVIDPVSGTLYVVAKTKENRVARYRLHALDIATGVDRSAGGVDIQASVAGRGGRVSFDARVENQRVALLLSRGVVYFGTGSYCDLGGHHGWMLGYDATTLAQRAVFNVTPNGTEGGIWQSGGGAAADSAGQVYVATGNGSFDPAAPAGNYGNTVLKLGASSLAVLDYFTPFNQQVLSDNDGDLGSAGVVLLPDQPSGPPHLVLGAGKQGMVYLLDRDNLGKFQTGNDGQIVQSLPAGNCGAGACPVFGTPAYFNQTVYFAAVGDRLRAFTLTGGRLTLSAASPNTFRWPGATPVVSANGSGHGLVWALETNGSGAPAVLHAYAADNIAVELYNTTQNPGRDAPGTAIKFAVPTVAAGKVYVGTQGQVSVFGLLR